jgi:hypothetical protein
MPDIYGNAGSKITTSVQDTTFDPRAFIGNEFMSRDKKYDEYCLKAGIENHNTRTDTLGSATPPPPTSPIRTALVLLDTRLSDLQATVERLFSALRPVTTNTDDNRPGEPAVAREGNSPLNIDINAMADRLGVITVALQVQVDRLEV